MDGGFQFLDILFFAMIAAFLVLRLRRVLGRRTGHQQRPPDGAVRSRPEPEAEGKVIELPDRSGRPADADPAATNGAADDATGDAADDPAAAGLARIRSADAAFDADEFVHGARSAFEMIVHAFATGDTGTLRDLLHDDVLDNFSAEIDARLERGETLETTVIAIRSADVVDAGLHGHIAIVTMKFVTEQVNVTRDTEGRVIEGDPNQVTEVTDIWTFTRSVRARDPNWRLIETRSPN